MAVATYNSHVESAKYFLDKNATTYLAIGKTSAWSDEENPPQDDPNATKLDEVIGYKKADKVSLCRPLVSGEETTFTKIVYGNKTWVLVPKEKATEEGAKWLYAHATIEADDLPLGMYRQVGVHVDLTPSGGIAKLNLLPSEVGSTGTLMAIDNREPQNRIASSSVEEAFILAF